MTATNGASRPLSNHILSALPREEYDRLAPHLENIKLSLNEVFYEPEAAMPYVYFPYEGTVSLVTVMQDGSEVEVGITGREGVVGLPVVLGGNQHRCGQWCRFQAAECVSRLKYSERKSAAAERFTA